MTNLLAVLVTGETRAIGGGYHSVKDALDGATVDTVRLSATAAAYIDDEGLLKGLVMNVPASMFCGRALYGPIVLMHAEPDDSGDSQAPEPQDVDVMRMLAERWRSVMVTAEQIGQTPLRSADADTVPPPQFYSLDDLLGEVGDER